MNLEAWLSLLERRHPRAIDLGLRVRGGSDAAIKGPQGNLEYFLWLEK